MLENVHHESCQQAQVKLGIDQERYAERSKEREGDIEAGGRLETKSAK
jgi:hypothetical protein